jgi:hypothetical protein
MKRGEDEWVLKRVDGKILSKVFSVSNFPCQTLKISKVSLFVLGS